MIAPALVMEVRRLLGERKLSQRAIAKATGVSRGTVSAIASGKRPDYRPAIRDNELHFDDPIGPPEKCPTCGGMVYMPCRLCQIRHHIAKMPRPTITHNMESSRDGIGLALRDAELIRYAKIRAKKNRERSFLLRKSSASVQERAL